MARLLEKEEIDRQLTDLAGWALGSGGQSSLVRTIEFPDFPTAIRAVDAIALDAEAMDHHPDIDIRWRRLRVELSTHSVGGLSQLDIELAHQINAVAAELQGR